MIYELQFVPSAQKEWKKLDSVLKEQFKKKLAQRLQNPHIPKDRLCGRLNFYKIKLKTSGYRLVYEVDDGMLIVLILAIGKRSKGEVYKQAARR